MLLVDNYFIDKITGYKLLMHILNNILNIVLKIPECKTYVLHLKFKNQFLILHFILKRDNRLDIKKKISIISPLAASFIS